MSQAQAAPLAPRKTKRLISVVPIEEHRLVKSHAASLGKDISVYIRELVSRDMRKSGRVASN